MSTMQKSAPPPSKHSPTKGFTLIELLAVVAIMVLLMTFTLPMIRGGNDLTKSAWDIAGIIDQARAYAMAQNTYVWVGFNEAQASTTSQKNIAVFVVASKDGSSNAIKSNLVQIGRTSIFDNLAVADFSASSFDYGNRKRGADGVVQLAGRHEVATTSILPGKLTAYTNTRMIQIDPEGAVNTPTGTAIATVEMLRWIELGLQPRKGTVVPGNNTNTAAIQIAGLTGQTRIFRPQP
jgi:prepilin-type N-terminal cleavage/methylation domain-containing protein